MRRLTSPTYAGEGWDEVALTMEVAPSEEDTSKCFVCEREIKRGAECRSLDPGYCMCAECVQVNLDTMAAALFGFSGLEPKEAES